jgi:16S rRNA (cytosine967-C5)-methyltransferase
VLRWHGVLSEQALKLIGKQQADLHPKVQLILELGIWQLAMGYAEHASIHQCVDACEQVGLLRAKNFVNAILRKAQSAINDDGWKLQNQPYQFPEPLSNILLAQEFCQDPSLRLGAYTGQLVEQIQPIAEQIHNQLCQLQTTQPSISLRIQTNRIKPEKYQEQLSKLGIKSEIGCYENSLIIRQPIQVEKLPGYSVGAVVIQDMAAQCAAHILNPKAQMSVLDACAAPGGKASHLQELADNKLELIALEIDEYRSRRLRENFGRMRTNGKVVIGSAILPAEWWHGRAFDLILADVPCSGTGVMRRHPDIPWLRKKEEIIAHSAESLKMLNRLWSLLKEKGSLLFATCSVLPEENDFVIEQFLRQNNNAKKAEFSLPLPHLETIHGKQIIPQLDNDSLYYCLLTKEKPLL